MEKQEEINEKRTSSTMEDPPRNISGRIMNSASGLLRASLSPKSTQHASTLTQVLANEGKAGPSTASASAEGGTTSQLNGRSDAHQSPGSLPVTNSAFREQARANGSINSSFADSGGMSLDQFMHTAQDESKVPPWQHSPNSKGKHIARSLDGDDIEDHATRVALSAVWHSNSNTKPSQAFPPRSHVAGHGKNGLNITAEINTADGADVVKLLQEPYSPSWMDMPEKEDIAYTISEADMKIADEIVRRTDLAVVSKPVSTSTTLGVNSSEPSVDFPSFFDDLENYQDEVWGYLRPLVEEAKRESAVSISTDEDERPATRRLRMILAHIHHST